MTTTQITEIPASTYPLSQVFGNNDLLQYVLEYLSFGDYYNSLRVCKKWHEICIKCHRYYVPLSIYYLSRIIFYSSMAELPEFAPKVKLTVFGIVCLILQHDFKKTDGLHWKFLTVPEDLLSFVEYTKRVNLQTDDLWVAKRQTYFALDDRQAEESIHHIVKHLYKCHRLMSVVLEIDQNVYGGKYPLPREPLFKLFLENELADNILKEKEEGVHMYLYTILRFIIERVRVGKLDSYKFVEVMKKFESNRTMVIKRNMDTYVGHNNVKCTVM